MDNLFKVRRLTATVNEMQAPSRRIYNRFFQPREHLEPSSRLAFEVITGSQKVMKNVSIYAPAEVRDKTDRKVITLQAPRLPQKRHILTAELDSMRAYGEQVGLEMMDERIARELRDMRNEVDRTLEFWATRAFRGKILDADLSTELVDYNMDASHLITLTGTSLFTSASSDPLARLRAWKKVIEDDANAPIDGWVSYMGSEVMDALLKHSDVRELLRYGKGSAMAENGRIERLAEIEFNEYNGFFLDDAGNKQRFIDEKYMLLIGVCDELVDCPYAPIVDSQAPGGVGNTDPQGRGVLYFSKSWATEDPDGRWIKVEARPLPVLQRPGAVIYAKCV